MWVRGDIMVVYRWIVVLCVGLFVTVMPAGAAEFVKDLYQATEVVSVDATDNEINQAMSDGLASVIVRVSGSTTSLAHPVILDALKSPKQFLSRFRYEPSTEIQTNRLGEVVHTKKFVLDFDVFRVKTLLSSGLVPVWDDMRPTILTWIAVERTNRREILSSLTTDDVFLKMDKVARERGLSYELPEMDLIDQLSISVSEVWGLFPDVILNASSRYNPEMVLAGRIYLGPLGKWNADFLIIAHNTTKRLQASADTVEDLFGLIADPVAEMMSRQYAVVLGGSNLSSTVIGVSDVASLKDYAAVLKLFQSMGPVNHVQVGGVEGDNVILNVDSYGSDQKLIDNLLLYRDQLTATDLVNRPDDRPDSEKWYQWHSQTNAQ